MRIVATRTTAVLAGAFAAVGLELFDRWSQNHAVGRPAMLLVLAVVWVVPAVLFAVGFDLKRWDPDYFNQPRTQADLREIGIRSLCWFLSTIVAGVMMSAL